MHETRESEDVELGTNYKNDTGAYFVTGWEKDKLFELTAIKDDYAVLYRYKKLDNNRTQLTYTEWMHDETDLKDPFSGKELLTLKKVMENGKPAF